MNQSDGLYLLHSTSISASAGSQQADSVTLEAEKTLTTSISTGNSIYVLKEISIHRACGKCHSHVHVQRDS